MKLIDADELIEHAWREKLDSREAIVNMINNAPEIEIDKVIRRMECKRRNAKSNDGKYTHCGMF